MASSFNVNGLKTGPCKALGGALGFKPLANSFVARRLWIDEAYEMRDLINSGLSQREASRLVGYSETTASRLLGTLELPAWIICHAGVTDNRRGRVLYSRDIFFGLVDQRKDTEFLREVADIMTKKQPLTTYFIRSRGEVWRREDLVGR